jgi:O-phosphoseryl-tRNA synthetase
MNEEIGVKNGEMVTEILLKSLGLTHLRFEKKKVTSKYYTPGTEYEGYAYHPKMKKWIEIVNYGLYNPIALARYDLEYPVLNIGIGVERVALVLYDKTDMRRLVYPQFYVEQTLLSDVELAKMVRIEKAPESKDGVKIRNALRLTALKYSDEASPCEFLAYEGKILDKVIRAYVYETDKDAKLLGPAAQNRIYVHNGNILGVPLKGMEHITDVNEIREKGVFVGFDYLNAITALASAKIEEAIALGRKKIDVRVKMVKNPNDINVKISEVARRYITSNKKRIRVSGPVFVGIRAEIAS